MRFHTLLPVRDEADIIGQCLSHLLTWADTVYVFDTGSIDNTWEIVLDAAAQDSRIVPIKKEPVYYSETKLRGYMFHVARQQMQDGDWFLRVDADEFHHVLPPDFVQNDLRPHETIVYHQYYDFQLTQSEVDAWEHGEESIADRQRPIADRRRNYIPSYYSEPRLCRYRSTMQWPANCSFPINAGYVAQERLPIRHYPHRDPQQLDRRYRLRAVMLADPTNQKNWARPEEHHWSEANWRKVIVGNQEPSLQYWQPGTELPRLQLKNHLESPQKRIIQRLTHTFLLPVLDRTRAAFTVKDYPQPILEATQQRLKQELGEAIGTH